MTAKHPKCPKDKAVFKATAPDGSVEYRSSARDYEWAVAVSDSQGKEWSIWSFHGTRQLAAKAWPGRNTRVVPAEIVEDRRVPREA